MIALPPFKDFAPRLRPPERPLGEIGAATPVIDWGPWGQFAPRLRPEVPARPKPPRELPMDPFVSLGVKQFAPRLRPASAEPKELDPTWWRRANCAGKPTNWWFPGPGGAQEPAKRVCRACEVREECENYADENQIEWGIWGGKIRKRDAATKKRLKAKDRNGSPSPVSVISKALSRM